MGYIPIKRCPVNKFVVQYIMEAFLFIDTSYMNHTQTANALLGLLSVRHETALAAWSLLYTF